MKKHHLKHIFIFFMIVAQAVILALVPWLESSVHAVTRSIVFPVIGQSSFSNDYDAPRGDQRHEAIDIIAKKGQKLVSVVSGTIVRVNYPQPSWGYAIYIRDSAGYTYGYLHINDDNPGSNDGKGGGMHAYAPDMKAGNPIVKGQLIGWVGDSGNSNGVSHLHFEMEDPNGNTINPYSSLRNAPKISAPKTYPQLPNELMPFSNAKIGVNVAMGNVDADSQSELVVGAGAGGGPRVSVFDANNVPIKSFYAFHSSFKGGIDVAMGDFDGDGIDELLVGAGKSGSPRVKVFKLNGTLLTDFHAYAPGFKGGIKVAAGDVNGDGVDEIITGAGAGGGPRVSVFELDGTRLSTFYAYSETMRGGIDVSAANVTGSAPDEIVTGPGKTGGPRVNIFDMSGTKLSTYYAYTSTYKGGIRVSAGNTRTNTTTAEILTSTADAASPNIRVYNFSGSLLNQGYFIEEWWRGPFDVAAGAGTSRAATGSNRRPSVRTAVN